MELLESSLTAGITQTMAIRVDWTKWRQFFRGMQENPLVERIFASVESQEASGATSDWRLKIESAAPEELVAIIGQALRDVVGSVLRVKPDTLRDDQPLTELGLDSLMGVEIENSIESAIGVTLPPASLIRARTIAQIVALIAEHMGVKGVGGVPVPTTGSMAAPEEASTDDVNMEALSDEEIDGLLRFDSALDGPSDSQDVVR
jgi:acyl carrier protein